MSFNTLPTVLNAPLETVISTPEWELFPSVSFGYIGCALKNKQFTVCQTGIKENKAIVWEIKCPRLFDNAEWGYLNNHTKQPSASKSLSRSWTSAWNSGWVFSVSSAADFGFVDDLVFLPPFPFGIPKNVEVSHITITC